MIRRPPRSTLSSSSAASDVYKRQPLPRRQVGEFVSDDWSTARWKMLWNNGICGLWPLNYLTHECGSSSRGDVVERRRPAHYTRLPVTGFMCCAQARTLSGVYTPGWRGTHSPPQLWRPSRLCRDLLSAEPVSPKPQTVPTQHSGRDYSLEPSSGPWCTRRRVPHHPATSRA